MGCGGGLWILLAGAVSGQMLFPSMPLRDGSGQDQPYLIHPGVPPPILQYSAILDAYQNPAVGGQLGSPCSHNETCAATVPNSVCRNGSCDCLESFYAEPRIPNVCRLAPGYGEQCALDGICRSPFTCNASATCDCPIGTIQEFYQCVPDCPSGHVPVDGVCYPGADLGAECAVSEQCVQSYADCRHGRCQCIAGANQQGNACAPVSKCPLGEVAVDGSGGQLECESGSVSCPPDHYCLYPEFADSMGFCCPKVQLNCPIGHPLPGTNCSNCPWDTHHCFSYVIGSYTETMCCPNACPSSQPIQTGGNCYPRAAFGGHCEVSEQCYNVVGSECRSEGDAKRCLCPPGNFRHHFGRCIRVAQRGESCGEDAECAAGSNTVCREGACDCYPGYMPRPGNGGSCIAEPTCPISGGVKVMRETYTDCSTDNLVCGANNFCRTWWFDLDNTTFALCCPKPSRTDYEAICEPLGLGLVLGLGTRLPAGNAVGEEEATDFPVACDLAPVPPAFLFQDAVPSASIGPVVGGRSPPRLCPPGATCIFDPFSVNKGVCCAQAPPLEVESDSSFGCGPVVGGRSPARLCATCIFDPFIVNKGVCCAQAPPLEEVTGVAESSGIAAILRGKSSETLRRRPVIENNGLELEHLESPPGDV